MRFLLLFLIIASPLQARWLQRKAEGWAWYEEKIEENDGEASKVPVTFSEQITSVREELEEKLAKAVLEPTEENLKDYMEQQHKWTRQAGYFAQLWSRLLLQYPHLDQSSAIIPTSQYGTQVKKQLDYEERSTLINDLALKNGLFFFYEGEKKASQSFSFIVKEFSRKYNWKVIPISIDETALSTFPETRPNNGIVEKLNITIYPSLYIVDPDFKEIIPIAFGLVTMDQIERNIDLQYSLREDLCQ